MHCGHQSFALGIFGVSGSRYGLKSMDSLPCLLVMTTDEFCVSADYMMPEMSGTEFCTIFRETVPRSVSPAWCFLSLVKGFLLTW